MKNWNSIQNFPTIITLNNHTLGKTTLSKVILDFSICRFSYGLKTQQIAHTLLSIATGKFVVITASAKQPISDCVKVSQKLMNSSATVA